MTPEDPKRAFWVGLSLEPRPQFREKAPTLQASTLWPPPPKKNRAQANKKEEETKNQGHKRPKIEEKKNAKKLRKKKGKETFNVNLGREGVTKFWEEIQIGWCLQPEKGGEHKGEALKGYPSRFPKGDP